jgi:hypothetical protein
LPTQHNTVPHMTKEQPMDTITSAVSALYTSLITLALATVFLTWLTWELIRPRQEPVRVPVVAPVTADEVLEQIHDRYEELTGTPCRLGPAHGGQCEWGDR